MMTLKDLQELEAMHELNKVLRMKLGRIYNLATREPDCKDNPLLRDIASIADLQPVTRPYDCHNAPVVHSGVKP